MLMGRNVDQNPANPFFCKNFVNLGLIPMLLLKVSHGNTRIVKISRTKCVKHHFYPLYTSRVIIDFSAGI